MSLFSRLSIFLLFSLLIPASVYSQANGELEEESFEHPISYGSDSGAYKHLNSIPAEVRRSKPFARYLHRFGTVAGSSGVYDNANRVKEFEESQRDLMRPQDAFKAWGTAPGILADAWTNIGPTDTGGCTNAIACDPKNGSVWYAGAAGGGVWKTTNSGTSWTPLTDLVIPNLAVASIAIDPVNTNIIYAGSGDAYASTDALAGSGLYRSTDAGLSWQRIGTNSLTGTIVKVLVHPTKTNIVYASQYDDTRAIYRSMDTGATWSKIYPTSGSAQGIVWDIVSGAVVGGNATLYMVEGNNPGGSAKSSGIYRSTNDGTSWTKLANIFSTDSVIGRAMLACPIGRQTKVFALVARPDGSLNGLFRSSNSGNAWNKFSTTPSTLFKPSAQVPAQGWFDLCLAVGPNAANTDTILIGGVEAWYTHNSGTSWTQYSGYNLDDSRTPHVDHHAITMDPRNPKVIMIGTDGGIYRSANGGASWAYRSNKYSTMRFYKIGLDKSDSKSTWGGAQDQGTWKHTIGSTYTGLRVGGDGFQPIVHPTSSNTVYAELPFGQIFKTTNGSYFVQLGTSYFNDDAGWEAPFKMSPTNPNTLFLGREKVWKSTDAGQSWAAISPVLGSELFDPTIRALCISPANSNVIWTGHVQGKIKLSTNGGTAWNDRSSGLPSTVEVTSIVSPQRDPTFAVASFASSSTTTARVMYTTNQGANWVNASGATATTRLKGVPVRAIALDSIQPTRIWYAATDNGMYYTMDSGKSWMIAGSGIGLAPCWDVQIHPNRTTIRVGTHGRGIWEANTAVLPVELGSLELERSTEGTLLKWHTDSEKNNSHFVVTRSQNYQPFEELTPFVNGAGDSWERKNYSFLDRKTEPGLYMYQLKQVDLDGSESYSNIVTVRYGRDDFSLDQNFPNPFFSGDRFTTRFRFSLPERGAATLSIYDAAGGLSRTLQVPETQGQVDLDWDGRDESGMLVASGTYVYVLRTAGGEELWNKMIIVRR